MPPVQKANITQCYMYNTLISHYKQTMPHVQKSNITLQTNCHVYKMLLLLFGWAFTRQLTYFWRALILYNSPLDSVLSGRGLLHYHMTWRRAINDSTTTRNICNQVREAPPPLLLLKSNCHTYLPYLDYRCRIYYAPVFILWIVLICNLMESN